MCHYHSISHLKRKILIKSLQYLRQAVLCAGVESSSVSRLEVWWKYAVHFDAEADREAAMKLFEIRLASELEDGLLQCQTESETETRRLVEGEQGIVGIDFLPLDEELSEGKSFVLRP